jgi:TonB family protein
MLKRKWDIEPKLFLCGFTLAFLSACSAVPPKINSGSKCHFDDDTKAAKNMNVDKQNDSTNLDSSKHKLNNFKILDEKPPIYPAYAEKNRIDGFVKAVITVKRDGAVESFKITESCPDTLFTQAVSSIIPTMKVTPLDTADTTSLRCFKRTWKFKSDHTVTRRISFGFGYTGGFCSGHFPLLINYEGYVKKNYFLGASFGYTLIQNSNGDRYFFEKIALKKYMAGKYRGVFLGGSIFYGFGHSSTNEIKTALFANVGYLYKWKRIYTSLEGGVGPGFVKDSNRELEFKPIINDVHWNLGISL